MFIGLRSVLLRLVLQYIREKKKHSDFPETVLKHGKNFL